MGKRNIIDALLPRVCVLCRFPSETNLCGGCEADLPAIGDACGVCGVPLDPLWPGPDAATGTPRFCGPCIRKPPPFRRTVAALQYRFPVTVLVQAFKFRRNFACGAVLGEKLVQVARREIPNIDCPPEVFVPVPLHPVREFFRVFNQAEVLARHLGRALDIGVATGVLRRTRRTRPQPGLSAIERRRNLSGAFVARRTVVRHVGLVDDVMTTGTTITECATALRKAGVMSVTVWVAARAE